jgi:shikimate kinase
MNAALIYLIGFLGSGKTTAGRLLARKLGWGFIDLDQEIERGEGQSIAEIFRSQGELHFRSIEHKYLETVSLLSQKVVALGGGTFVDAGNRALAEKTGLTVWLKVSFARVVHRVTMDGTRPMFTNREQAERLYLTREPLYSHAAVHITTDDKSPEVVADEILGAIKKL